MRMAKALENYKDLPPKTRRNRLIERELARGWRCEGYCFLTAREQAEKMTELCGHSVSVKALKIMRRRLGLVNLQKEGRPDWKIVG